MSEFFDKSLIFFDSLPIFFENIDAQGINCRIFMIPDSIEITAKNVSSWFVSQDALSVLFLLFQKNDTYICTW